MTLARMVLTSLTALCAFPAFAQQPAQPSPPALDTARAAFHDMIGLCVEAHLRGQRVQELPAEVIAPAQLAEVAVVRAAGAASVIITDWYTRRSSGVFLRNFAPGCEAVLTPTEGKLESFDAAAEATLATAVLLAKLPGLAERRFFPPPKPSRPFEDATSGRRFIKPGGQGPGPAYVATYVGGSVKVAIALDPPTPFRLDQRFRQLERCSIFLRNAETFSVYDSYRDRPVPGVSPAAGYSFYWQPPYPEKQPWQALGENPADPQSCAYLDRKLTLDQAREMIPAQLDGIAFTAAQAKGGGVVIVARLDPAQVAP